MEIKSITVVPAPHEMDRVILHFDFEGGDFLGFVEIGTGKEFCEKNFPNIPVNYKD